MEFCHKVIPTRSQYADVAEHKCHCPKGHSGKCEEFPFLRQYRTEKMRNKGKCGKI